MNVRLGPTQTSLLALAALALAALASAPPLGAQRAGTLEIGGFAQQIDVGSRLNMADGSGGGARLGVFLDQRWQLEGELTFARLEAQAPRVPVGRTDLRTQIVRVNYGVPFGAFGLTHEFFVGAGGGRVGVGGVGDFALSATGGVRLVAARWLALRLDVAFDHSPGDGVDVPGERVGNGVYTNRLARAGVSIMTDLLPPSGWRALHAASRVGRSGTRAPES